MSRIIRFPSLILLVVLISACSNDETPDNGNYFSTMSTTTVNMISMAHAVQVLPDSNFIVAGERGYYSDPSDDHAYVLKCDKSGNIQWLNTLQFSTPTIAREVEIIDGTYLVLCHGYGSSSKITFVKIDVTGEELWRKDIDGYDGYKFGAFRRISDSELLLYLDNDNGFPEILVLDGNANIVSSITIETEFDGILVDAEFSSNKELLLIYLRYNDVLQRDKVITCKVNSYGGVRWKKEYPAEYYCLESIVGLDNGNSIFQGYYNGTNRQIEKFWFVGSTGTFIDSVDVEFNQITWIDDLKQTNSDNILILGYTSNVPCNGYPVIASMENDGQLNWEWKLDSNPGCYLYRLILNNNYDLFATGVRYDSSAFSFLSYEDWLTR